jgi:hypothetical protein
VLHEIGHHLDYLEKVEWPMENADTDGTDLWDRYWQRPSAEREAFAHRYADRVGAELRDEHAIPFARLDAPERIRDLGLRPDDFDIDTGPNH